MKRGYKHISRLMMTAVFLSVLLLGAGISVYGATPTATGTINEDGTRIRSSYSTYSDIVTVLSGGTTVTVTKEKFKSASSARATKRWYYIKKGTITGWVRADLISVTTKDHEGSAVSGVNIRKGAGTGFSAIGSFAKGDEVSVRLRSYSSGGSLWYKVKYKGYLRYVSGQYIELIENSAEENTNFDEELARFPSGYHKALKNLHEKYPSWHFKAKKMSYSWKAALAEQCVNYAANTVPYSKPDGYKAVAEGTYDFDNHTYYGLDGSSWVAASKKAVAFYMDPRNWLDEINIFMFESLSYDGNTQSETMVKSILEETAIASKYSSSYMKAGLAYDISPVYLAAKSRLELGPYDYMVSGTKFTYNGKTYQGYYNAYNIGASDSASGNAAKKGLVYAASGSTYLRPWTTLDKAIRGGAKYIAEDFIGNQQHTLYYERFNVANGLVNIGTHQYMTNTMAAATQANITYWNYEENDMLDTAFTFEIPVYTNMPSKKAAEPGGGNNNNYLDSLKVYAGSTRKYFTETFDRFDNSYKLKYAVPYEVEKVTVKTTTNADDAKVTVTGNKGLKVGSNKIKVKVTSASGLSRYYYVKVTRANAKVVIAPEVKITNRLATGKPRLTWEAAPNADEYKIYRSTDKNGTYKLVKTVKGCSFTDNAAKTGTTYYYKVKSVGTSGITGEATGKIVYRTCDLPRPEVSASNVEASGKIKLSWKKITGAKSYVVYRATSKKGTYKKLCTTTRCYLTNTSAEAGKTYYYKVKAISKLGTTSDSARSTYVFRTCDLPRPVVKATNVAATGKVKLSWKKITGAKSYVVYRATSKDGTYKKLYTTENTTMTNISAKAGKTYYYKVKAIAKSRNAANSALSEFVKRTCDLPRPVIAVKLTSKGKPKVSWEEVKGAKLYEVYRATSKNGTYRKLITTSKTYVVNTRAKSGNTYYYKVKALSEVKGAADSAYSLIKAGNSK